MKSAHLHFLCLWWGQISNHALLDGAVVVLNMGGGGGVELGGNGVLLSVRRETVSDEGSIEAYACF